MGKLHQRVFLMRFRSQSYSGFRSFGKADFSRFFQSTGVVFRSLTSPRSQSPNASPPSAANNRQPAKRNSRASPGPQHHPVPQTLSSGPPSHRSTSSSTSSRDKPPPPASTPPPQQQNRMQQRAQSQAQLNNRRSDPPIPGVKKSASLPAESLSNSYHKSSQNQPNVGNVPSSKPSESHRLSFSASQDDISKELAKYGVVAPIPEKQSLITTMPDTDHVQGVSKDITAEIFGAQSRSQSPSLFNATRSAQPRADSAAAQGTSPLSHVQLPEGIDFKPVPADKPVSSLGVSNRLDSSTSSNGKRKSLVGIPFGKLRFPKDYGTRHFDTESVNLHKEAISALCISDDGTTLYSADRGSNFSIYSIHTKQTRRQTR